jgi:hypothetical protein
MSAVPGRPLSSASAVPIPFPVEPPSLPDREIGRLALGRLSFGTWQRRADEGPVYRPLVFGVTRRLAHDVCVFRPRRRLGRLDRLDRLDSDFGFDRLLGLGRHQDGWVGGLGRRGRGDTRFLLLPRRRNLGLLVLVLGITRGAACPLHLVFDHRDDRMVGDAALARTIVIENVTEPNPAMLHELPRSNLQVGRVKQE